MQYELCTVLGLELGDGSTQDDAASSLRSALDSVLHEPEYGAVVQFFVTPHEDINRLVVGIRFDGMNAQYVEDTADEILERAISIVEGREPIEHKHYREESVRLQPVPA